MLISIIIPIYKVSDYIERCLLSALNQTYPDIEYLLVDDATPDDSMEKAAEILKNHPRKNAVKIIRHPENKGISAARNTGVKASAGNYIFFLDSDDEIVPDCIEALVALTGNQTPDLIIGEIRVIGNRRNRYPQLLLQAGIYQGDCILASFLNRKWYEMAWNKLIKRSIFFDRNCWFEEGIVQGEDTLWGFQSALSVRTMAVTHLPTYHYHIQKKSVTQNKSHKNVESFYFVLKKIIRLATDNRLFDNQKSMHSYVEGLRIYFLKMLINNRFEESFILEQKNRLDLLFEEQVWPRQRKSFTTVLKEKILAAIFCLKYKRP